MLPQAVAESQTDLHNAIVLSRSITNEVQDIVRDISGVITHRSGIRVGEHDRGSGELY